MPSRFNSPPTIRPFSRKMESDIQGNILEAASVNGTWGSQAWTAPYAAKVIGVSLSFSWIRAAGAGSDIVVELGLFSVAPTGSGLLVPTSASSQCYAFLEAAANEIVGSADQLYGQSWFPMLLNVDIGRTLSLAIFCDSAVHTAVGHAVIQFQRL